MKHQTVSDKYDITVI